MAVVGRCVGRVRRGGGGGCSRRYVKVQARGRDFIRKHTSEIPKGCGKYFVLSWRKKTCSELVTSPFKYSASDLSLSLPLLYRAVSTKVVPQKCKSVRDNADWYYG